ncbi:MAG: STAS/SEC14 domain-containing protein [Pseudomonadota bacterium]
MINIRLDEVGRYIELEVFGAYQPEKVSEILASMRGLAESYGRFSVIEIRHGKPTNLLAMLGSASKASGSEKDYKFLSKLWRYAVVSDEPGFLFRLAAAFGTGQAAKIKLFKQHEADLARQWVKQEKSQVTSVPMT